MKAIIIENEESAAKGMARLLETFCPDVEIIGIANDGLEGISLVNELQPNIIFLDIVMPGIDGFQVLNKLHNRSINVVITTAHDKYAIQAIKHQAIDYLLKPIDPVELMSVINKVQTLIGREEYIKEMELKFLNSLDEEFELNIDYELTRQFELSKREIEILKLSLKVKSAKEISDQLFLSTFTSSLLNYILSFSGKENKIYICEHSHPHAFIRLFNSILNIVFHLSKTPLFIEKNIMLDTNKLLMTVMETYKDLQEKKLFGMDINNLIENNRTLDTAIVHHLHKLIQFNTSSYANAMTIWNETLK